MLNHLNPSKRDKRIDDSDPDSETEEKLLVFKDLEDQVWQISKVDKPLLDFS